MVRSINLARHMGFSKTSISHAIEVFRKGELVPMPHHEFFTLLYLTQHPSWVLSKEQIYEAVWRENPEHCGATVANVAYSFRRKIGEGYIETVVGSGYRFVG